MSRRPLLVVLVAAAVFVMVFVWRSDAGITPFGDRSSGGQTPPNQRVGYATSLPGALLSSLPSEPGRQIASGVVFAVTGERDDGFEVFDVCNGEGWLSAEHVDPGYVPIAPDGFGDAVFVIDPGHGHPDAGAIGPSGLTETSVNINVAARLVDLLTGARDIDWETGQVTAGGDYPPVAAAVMTRSPDGPNGGDYEVGLTFRATLANAVNATALVSIHHNSAPTIELSHPGSEAYVSDHDLESARLGGLIVDELRRGLAQFHADWMGGPGHGVIARVGETGSDFYTVIERSEVPAVIVEGAYISNPTEEALAMTDEFRQAYAEGVYRALVRFVTTADDPIPNPDRQVFSSSGPGRSLDNCVVPPAGG